VAEELNLQSPELAGCRLRCEVNAMRCERARERERERPLQCCHQGSERDACPDSHQEDEEQDREQLTNPGNSESPKLSLTFPTATASTFAPRVRGSF
jgi:hypothetical protein